MTVSFGMLGIVLMLDVCFIVNYFVVRALRQWTNAQQARERLQASRGIKKIKKDEPAVSGDLEFYGDVMFSIFFQSVRLEPMGVRKFPDWKPIPYRFGLVSTCIIVATSTILLSPDLLVKHLGISSVTLDADLCVAESYDSGIDALKEDLYNVTNLLAARQQSHVMRELHRALINDTSLYGVPPYQCPSRGDVSGLKEDWNSSASFFPSFCQAALEAAVQVASERECYQEICECPTLPDSPVFQVVGLADKEFCGAEVCIEVPHPCPPHADDIQDFAEAALEDYRLIQLEAAEKRFSNMTATRSANDRYPTAETLENTHTTATETADKILHQVDVASYIYIGYSCLALFFPSPLILFRMPYWPAVKRFLFGVQKPYFICFVVALWWGIEYFQAVWYSPDLRLFLKNIRSGDPCFVDADYLLERQSVLNEVCQELLPLHPVFNSSAVTVTDVVREIGFFADSCNCPFPNQHTSKLFALFNPNLREIGFNVTQSFCGGDNSDNCVTMYIPNENISFLGNTSICTNTTASRHLVWESHHDASQKTPWYELWIASGFMATLLIKVAVANFGLALMELADPFVVCAGEFLWMPSSFGNGKLSMEDGADSNSNRHLLEVFDEHGRALPKEMVQKWFKAKQRSLFHCAASKSLIWGILVHLCLINLFESVYTEVYENFFIADEITDDAPPLHQMLEERDMNVLAACLGTAGAIMVLGCYIIRNLNRMKQHEMDNMGDTDGESSDSDIGEQQQELAIRNSSRPPIITEAEAGVELANPSFFTTD